MSDKINLINIFSLRVTYDGDGFIFEIDPTQNFEMLFPEKDLMGRMFHMHVHDFLQDLLHFICSRFTLVSDKLDLEEYIIERGGLEVYLCLDSDNRCVLHREELDFMFTEICDVLDEEEYELFGTFLKYLDMEITDGENELTADMNDSWNMKEKGFGIEVLKVE